MEQLGKIGRHIATQRNADKSTNDSGHDIDHSFVVGRYGVPTHRFEVRQRRSTGISDCKLLWLCVFASLIAVIAATAAGLQRHDTRKLADLTVWLCVTGLAILIAVMAWYGFSWLRRHAFGDVLIFGYIPVGREDEHGRTRLYFERLIGKCGVDGSPMHVRRMPKRWMDVRDVYGNLLRRKVEEYQLCLVCDRNPDDEGHQGRLDPTETGNMR